jgi:hypothetical protein
MGSVDYRKLKPNAWRASNINDAMIQLYGRQRFSTIRQSPNVILTLSSGGAIKDSSRIGVAIESNILATSVALLSDVNEYALIGVWEVQGDVVSMELEIALERKGTLFVVVEGRNGILYYARAFADVIAFSCGVS